MWILILIIITVIGFFLFVRVASFLYHREYYREFKHIFKAHKEIGYPRLTEEQQFDILDNENWSHISKLTKFKFVPTGLLDNYITIKPKQYLNHLKTLNLKDRLKYDPQNLHDGFFINEIPGGCEYLSVERQKIVFKKRFSNYDKLLKYIMYDKLSSYASKKYKFAWLKKHLV